MSKPSPLQRRPESSSSPHRLERLRNWISDNQVDALLVTGAINVAYITGYWRYYNLPAAALLEPDGQRTLLVTRDEVPVAKETTDVARVFPWTTRGFGLDLDLMGLLAKAIAELEPVANARRLGFADGIGVEAALAPRISSTLLAADEAIQRFRCVKDPDELAALLSCYELAWGSVEAVRAAAADGASEIEMFSIAQTFAQAAHGEPIEFSADVLCGPHTSDDGPRRIAGARRVGTGESVTADIRVGFDGFWSDICETIIVAGNDEIAAARAALLEILDGAATLLAPGATGAQVYSYVAEAIADGFPGGAFVHHAGHAVGREPIEAPRLMPSDHTPLEAGMVFSIEPGVYFDGRWGARVEKTYVVGPHGGTELSAA